MRALFFAVLLGLSHNQISAGQTATNAQQPDPGITTTGAIGEVKTIDATARQITIKTDAGSLVRVTLSDKTAYKRLAPGEQSLTNATDITVADIAEGDRVWARGRVAADHSSVPAVAVIVMSHADIVKKQEAERMEWRRRGILGVVTALKPETKEITITSRIMAGAQTVVISVDDKTEIRRYAPDSIKFSDAQPSSFAELKVGDQLRALGDRSADGTHFTPQKVVSGSFRTVAGTVKEVDAATGEIKIADLEKKQQFIIVVKQDAVLRKFPAAGEMGGMLGGFGRGPGAGRRPMERKHLSRSSSPQLVRPANDQLAAVREDFGLAVVASISTISSSVYRPSH
ncbi:MAG: hypothetical protein ABR555_11810 [Pyrinomonadaceae bacterium]